MWLRLRQVALVAAELAPVVDDLSAVLGLEVCFNDPGVKAFGLENALLPVGNQFLEVVAPTHGGTAGGRYLERRGGRFVPCTDGRPEGLGGIDVAVVDRARVLAAARERGCLAGEGQVELAGMRIGLVDGG